jgi:hypothetical protein
MSVPNPMLIAFDDRVNLLGPEFETNHISNGNLTDG